jgi:hypothetical protein
VVRNPVHVDRGGDGSRMTYTTIEGAGWIVNQRGGITLDGITLEIDQVTLRKNVYAGLSVVSRSPVITNCTFDDNGGPPPPVGQPRTVAVGIWIGSGTGAFIEAGP